MAARTWYTRRQSHDLTGCTFREAELIEYFTRTHLLHSTLDWLPPEQFISVVREAINILREFYEAGDLPTPVRQFPSREDCVLSRLFKRIIRSLDGRFWHRHNGCKFSYTPKNAKRILASEIPEECCA